MFKRIQNLRIEANYSIEFVANFLEISISTYKNIENGKTKIKTKSLIKLAHLYNTSIDYIVEETDVRYKY